MSGNSDAPSSPVGEDERCEIERINSDVRRNEWQGIAEQFSAQINATIKKIVEPAREAQRAFKKTAEQIAAIQKQWVELIAAVQVLHETKIPRFNLPDLSILAKNAETIRESFRTAFTALQKAFRELPPKMQEALLLLGAHGWYFDLQMMFPQLWKLVRSIIGG